MAHGTAGAGATIILKYNKEMWCAGGRNYSGMGGSCEDGNELSRFWKDTSCRNSSWRHGPQNNTAVTTPPTQCSRPTNCSYI